MQKRALAIGRNQHHRRAGGRVFFDDAARVHALSAQNVAHELTETVAPNGADDSGFDAQTVQANARIGRATADVRRDGFDEGQRAGRGHIFDGPRDNIRDQNSQTNNSGHLRSLARFFFWIYLFDCSTTGVDGCGNNSSATGKSAPFCYPLIWSLSWHFGGPAPNIGQRFGAVVFEFVRETSGGPSRKRRRPNCAILARNGYFKFSFIENIAVAVPRAKHIIDHRFA